MLGSCGRRPMINRSTASRRDHGDQVCRPRPRLTRSSSKPPADTGHRLAGPPTSGCGRTWRYALVRLSEVSSASLPAAWLVRTTAGPGSTTGGPAGDRVDDTAAREYSPPRRHCSSSGAPGTSGIRFDLSRRVRHPRRLGSWVLTPAYPHGRGRATLPAMVLEVALIDVTPGRRRFTAAYAQAHPVLAGTPGCRSVRMTRGIESPSRFVLLVEWDSVEAHVRTSGPPRPVHHLARPDRAVFRRRPGGGALHRRLDPACRAAGSARSNRARRPSTAKPEPLVQARRPRCRR